jgi:hypothetical protein
MDSELTAAEALATYARTFGRGFLIVMLTATNAYQIVNKHYVGAFLVGTSISLVWWSNARTSARSGLPWAGLAYGLGAGTGTVTGMALATVLYGG